LRHHSPLRITAAQLQLICAAFIALSHGWERVPTARQLIHRRGDSSITNLSSGIDSAWAKSGGYMNERSRKERTNNESRPESHPDSDRVSLALPENDPPRQDADLIALRAYQRYEARGREDGHDMDDWFAAEQELREGSPRSQ
jgi:hypothetical protein